MTKKLLTFVLPAYNEQDNIAPFHQALTSVLEGPLAAYEAEMIFVDDGSADETLPRLKALAMRDKRVRVISFSRNFGHQAALTAGMVKARGDAIVTMDCDLQDPPDLIPKLVEKWEQGCRIVYARRAERHDSFLKKWTAALYYRLLSRVAELRIPRQVGDFRLVDRVALDNLLRLDEHARYLRGMVAWLGFKHDFVDYDRPERQAGQTHYSLVKMVRLAMDGVLNFSFMPLRIAFWIGFLSLLAAVAFLGYMLWDNLVRGVPYPLYKWLTVMVFGFMGSQFMFLWIIGEYIGRIYNDVRRRPLYVIQEEFGPGGIPPAPPAPAEPAP